MTQARSLGPPNRVPPVTVDFWLIKLMAVTMGETAADYLSVNMGLGLTATSMIMSALLVGAIALQFAQKRYVPFIYWAAVVLISIVGTLVTDNLTDNLNMPLEVSTFAFSIALILTFMAWKACERTLSIHSITTARREVFYWLCILFTFALGTAVGDLISENFGLGYLTTGLVFAVVIGMIVVAYSTGKTGSVLTFWLCYIFTRPLGASFGDYLSQPSDYGGLGFGTIYTSLMFLLIIAALVFYMTTSHAPENTPIRKEV